MKLRIPAILACLVFLAACSEATEDAPAQLGALRESVEADGYGCPIDSHLPDCVKAFLDNSLANGTGYRTWTADHFPRTGGIRMTGPLIAKTSAATHARARVYYSADVVTWLKGGRVGVIPDGSVIVKEMYVEDPMHPDPKQVTGWAVMIKNTPGSKDGWIWVLYYRPGNATNGLDFTALQQGMSYCLACHGSADNSELTFSSLGNIDGTDVKTYAYRDVPSSVSAAAPLPDAGHSAFASQQAGGCSTAFPGDLPTPLTSPNPAIQALFAPRTLPDPNDPNSVPPLPMDLFSDHVPVSPTNPDVFLSSDDCSGCHDASLLAGNLLPEMTVATTKGEQYNLSPWGEWSGSMMGLAARDPVFLAQLESEMKLRPQYSEYIQNFCLSCHAVQGERQFHLDGNTGPYLKAQLYTPPYQATSKYGALGRSGVACTVCHHVSSDGLGTESTWNARFKTGPANEIYGPFNDVRPYPMQQALGLTPTHGAQINDSALCGSCHTVLPPKIPQNGSGDPNQYAPAHEQTTFLEWQNSSYATGGAQAQSCVECHMPNDFEPLLGSAPLDFPIASIETGYFPEVEHRASFEQINVERRSGYRRHTLVGINVFANQMFQQFPSLLGHCVFDAAGVLPGPNSIPATNPIPRLRLAGDEAVRLAGRTVALEITSVGLYAQSLVASVRVTNRAGHKFPSGVGFRRAFLQFSVLDSVGNVIWSSGRVSKAGVLVDSSETPLPSEFTFQPQELLPNFASISDQAQVQVYEQRHSNDQGVLTTSFLGLFNEVKDNRILPVGWSTTGPSAEVTWPIQKGGAKVVNPVAGYDTVQYRIPVHDVPNAATVRVRLYYQSLPPYYMRDRFTAYGPETNRLFYMVNYLNLANTPMEGWSLLVAERTDAIR